jgi:hypothetical protein
MTNYPASLPTDALLLIVDRLRGKSNDWNSVLLASWNLLGFALSQVSLNSPDRILEAYEQAASISIETEEEAADYLETNLADIISNVEGKEPFQFSGVVLLIVIKLITKFIINVL